jgi:hypothetical protein
MTPLSGAAFSTRRETKMMIDVEIDDIVEQEMIEAAREMLARGEQVPDRHLRAVCCAFVNAILPDLLAQRDDLTLAEVTVLIGNTVEATKQKSWRG